MSTIERATGRWREILPQLGIESRFLINKHGPCPLCGGKDRFRFDDRDGSGSYYCKQCGPGLGLLLVRKLHGWDHKTACDAIDKIIGIGRRTPPSSNQSPLSAAQKEAAERQLLHEARESEVVETYLGRRGWTVTSPVLRGNARCAYSDEDKRLIGHFPAVIAQILGPDGSLRSAQRIYGADVTPRKKILAPVGTIRGGAVRLHEPAYELGVAEGIENALAAHELFRVPVWAALSGGGVKILRPLSGMRRVHIFADNDFNFVGQEASYNLALRLSQKGVYVEVHVPADRGTDWLDVLDRYRRQ